SEIHIGRGSGCWGMLYSCYSLGAVYYLFTAYTERAFLHPFRLFKHPLNNYQMGKSINLIKEYGDLPLVECYAGLLNQVFMNILTNAIDAVEESLVNSHLSLIKEQKTNDIDTSTAYRRVGQIRIRTEFTDDKQVIIGIADNGSGIPEKLKKLLFDPFFTTKPVGKGTGLGLSISYQIVVEKHGGELQCISASGEGTEFIIKIPVQDE
ncbi:sensor histidine kinase, partial [Nostoc sp.]|uniref:sensor histidine kinase n=1 Tax=Nostoc sp. TaxID=1180 RepID=UPI0035941F93